MSRKWTTSVFNVGGEREALVAGESPHLAGCGRDGGDGADHAEHD